MFTIWTPDRGLQLLSKFGPLSLQNTPNNKLVLVMLNISPILFSLTGLSYVGHLLDITLVRWCVWQVHAFHVFLLLITLTRLRGLHWRIIRPPVIFGLTSPNSSSSSQAHLSFYAQSSLPFLPEASHPGAGKFRSQEKNNLCDVCCMWFMLEMGNHHFAENSVVFWRCLGLPVGCSSFGPPLWMII